MHQVRIKTHPDYWFTVEDFYLDIGCDGLTISYWDFKDGKESRGKYISVDKSVALPIADAIYELFKKEDNQ